MPTSFPTLDSPDHGPVVAARLENKNMKRLTAQVRTSHGETVDETRKYYAFTVRKLFAPAIEAMGFAVPDGLPHSAHRKQGPGGLEYDCLVRVMSLPTSLTQAQLTAHGLESYSKVNEDLADDDQTVVDAFGEAKTTKRLIVAQPCLGIGTADVKAALFELNSAVATLKKLKHRVVFACLAAPIKAAGRVELAITGQQNDSLQELQDLWRRNRLFWFNVPNPLANMERSVSALEQCNEALGHDAAQLRSLTTQLSQLVGKRLLELTKRQPTVESEGDGEEAIAAAKSRNLDKVLGLSNDVNDVSLELQQRVQLLELRLGTAQRSRAVSII